jgi:hypothetical protein
MRLVDSNWLAKKEMPWCFRQDVNKFAEGGQAFLINLDDKGNPGTHWTAARLIQDVLHYADPFGSKLNGWPPAEFDPKWPQVINPKTFQRPESQLCGYYSYLFAKALNELEEPVSQKELAKILQKAII